MVQISARMFSSSSTIRMCLEDIAQVLSAKANANAAVAHRPNSNSNPVELKTISYPASFARQRYESLKNGKVFLLAMMTVVIFCFANLSPSAQANADTELVKAESLLAQGDLSNAKRVLQSFLARQPNSVTALNMLTSLLLLEDD